MAVTDNDNDNIHNNDRPAAFFRVDEPDIPPVPGIVRQDAFQNHGALIQGLPPPDAAAVGNPLLLTTPPQRRNADPPLPHAQQNPGLAVRVTEQQIQDPLPLPPNASPPSEMALPAPARDSLLAGLRQREGRIWQHCIPQRQHQIVEYELLPPSENQLGWCHIPTQRPVRCVPAMQVRSVDPPQPLVLAPHHQTRNCSPPVAGQDHNGLLVPNNRLQQLLQQHAGLVPPHVHNMLMQQLHANTGRQGVQPHDANADANAQQHANMLGAVMASNASRFWKPELQALLQHHANTPSLELKQALQAWVKQFPGNILDGIGMRFLVQELLWHNNLYDPTTNLRQEADELVQRYDTYGHAMRSHFFRWNPDASHSPALVAIRNALRDLGIQDKTFKEASFKKDLCDETLLALPDMPWDWPHISFSKSSLKESTLLTLRDKPWDYRFLSRLPWSDDTVLKLWDKDWNYELLGYKTMRSAELLLQTSTRAWDWLGQLGQLVEHAQHRVTVKQLLRKSLQKSDEVVWDWHKPFKNTRLASTLLSIALTETPKHPDEPWDYDKLSAAWWYPIDALLSLGADKPWNMDVVSARADLTTDHVLKLYPHAAWNLKITDKNPNIMAARRRRQELLKARDIILKVASSVPYGRLYLCQLKLFQKQQQNYGNEAI